MCSTKGIARLLGRESTKKTFEFSDLHSGKTNIAGWKMGPLKMLYAYISSPLLRHMFTRMKLFVFAKNTSNSPPWTPGKKQVMIYPSCFCGSLLTLHKEKTYCWWFRNPQQPPFGCKRTLVDNGINYQPQLLQVLILHPRRLLWTRRGMRPRSSWKSATWTREFRDPKRWIRLWYSCLHVYYKNQWNGGIHIHHTIGFFFKGMVVSARGILFSLFL